MTSTYFRTSPACCLSLLDHDCQMSPEPGQSCGVWCEGMLHGSCQSIHSQEQGTNGRLSWSSFGNFFILFSVTIYISFWNNSWNLNYQLVLVMKFCKKIRLDQPYHLATPVTKIAFRKASIIYFDFKQYEIQLWPS